MLLKSKQQKARYLKFKRNQDKCEHRNRCVISQDGWNLLYCPDCEKEWHDEDI